MRRVWLAPSEIRYLIDKCARCWWLKTRSVPIPRESVPAIFTQIDRGMKQSFTLEKLEQLGFEAREIIEIGPLRSKPITFEDLDVELVIKGQLDRLLELRNGTFAIVDFKTTRPRTTEPLQRQLHAYKEALENPVIGAPREVSQLALIIFDPSVGRFALKDSNAAITGQITRQDIPIEPARFHAELRKIAELAAQPHLPEAAPTCLVCHHAADVLRYATQSETITAPAT